MESSNRDTTLSGSGSARTPEAQRPLRLIRASDVYAPEALGAQDILVGGGRILAMGPDLSVTLALADIVESETWSGGRLIPGLIDQHAHFLGGGDGDGVRMPELGWEAFASAGTTTVVSPLGTDMDTKSLPQLLRKACELEERGLTTFIYTGAMMTPTPCLTGLLRTDLLLIDKVLGVKTAISERAAPNLDFPALATLAGDLVHVKGVTGKAALLHLHVGRLKSGLQMLFDLVDRMDFPLAQVVPTHINRKPDLFPVFEQGLQFGKEGGAIDFTCCLGPLDGLPSGMDVVEAVTRALDSGVPLDRMTLSSDAGVSVPDGSGGMRAVPPSILFRDLVRLTTHGGLSWSQALTLVTTNVARILCLDKRKGAISPGMDADLVLVGEDNRIVRTLWGGRRIFDQTKPVGSPHERS